MSVGVCVRVREEEGDRMRECVGGRDRERVRERERALHVRADPGE